MMRFNLSLGINQEWLKNELNFVKYNHFYLINNLSGLDRPSASVRKTVNITELLIWYDN